MKHIPIGNGSILFIRSEPAPNSVPGFYRDKNDPYIWHPEWPDCKYRLILTYTKPCGKLGQRVKCDNFKKDVNVSTCLACEVSYD